MKFVAILFKTVMILALSPMLIILGSLEAIVAAWTGERFPFDIENHL